MDASSSRRALRERLRAQRLALDPATRIAAARGVRDALDALPGRDTLRRVAGYWASTGELPLNLVVAALAARGARYFLPVIVAPRRLAFAAWDHDVALAANRYGIPEPVVPASAHAAPASLDAVLLPLLAFDRDGMRLGYGGGFYDASFAFLRERTRPARPLLVGVAYAFQEVPRGDPALAPQPWDVALDYVATEQGLIACAPSEEGTPCSAG